MSKRPQAETTSEAIMPLEEGRDDGLTVLLPDMGGSNGAVYSEPSDDLNAHHFLDSLLRAVVPM